MTSQLNLTQIVSRFINHTNRNVFLTGKAGTGKTTFLQNIKEHTHKNVIVAAPTGIAAINAGGVTLHSLFQLPFGAFVPDNNGLSNRAITTSVNTPRSLLSAHKMHQNKRNLLKKMELLIIDEVSMLRADLLDAIDLVLRSVRRNRELPFGGVQVLFIGDLLQLPPVVNEVERNILAPYYSNVFFFNAQVIKNNAPLYVELEKIYRQADNTFINLLNNLRNNKMTADDRQLLNRYYQPNYQQKADDGIISLTTHNSIANNKNQQALKEIKSKSIFFEAEVSGDFKEFSYPAEEKLEFKKGAQVMFTKNDYSGEHQYYNGKIGVISKLQDDVIEVSFSDGSAAARVELYEWENKKYTVNKENNQIEEEVVGRFKQYPIKLAWAITVHKSQGLTFDKAIIDVQNAFAPGQIYVALSRLRSLDGLILTSPIPDQGLVIDASLTNFAQQKKQPQELTGILKDDSRAYFHGFVMHAFELSALMQELYIHLSSYKKDEKRSVKQKYKPWVMELVKETEQLKPVADSFRVQVHKIINVETDDYLPHLQERVEKAIGYFEPIIKSLYEKVRSCCNDLRGVKGTKAYYNELIDISNLYYGQLQEIYKARTLIETSIKGTEFDKTVIKNPEFAESVEETTASKGNKEKVKAKKTGEKKSDTKLITYEMYKEGKSIEKIAKERSLTSGTIEGHLAHFVQLGELDILDFVSKEKLNIIEKEIHKQDSFALGVLKKELGNKVSYGEIKLVLAYMTKDKVLDR